MDSLKKYLQKRGKKLLGVFSRKITVVEINATVFVAKGGNTWDTQTGDPKGQGQTKTQKSLPVAGHIPFSG